MALSKDRLGDKWADFVLTLLPSAPTTADETSLRTLMKGLANEDIIEYIGFADVTVSSTGATLAHAPGGAATISGLPGSGGISS